MSSLVHSYSIASSAWLVNSSGVNLSKYASSVADGLLVLGRLNIIRRDMIKELITVYFLIIAAIT
jgi:hypothetical protein